MFTKRSEGARRTEIEPALGSTAVSLEEQLRAAFMAFFAELQRDAPWARERELISLFAFGALADAVLPGAPLHSQRQIAIECAVEQRVNRAQSGKPKADVCKDLLIWPRPGQTAWGSTGKATNNPLAIIEWKGGRATGSRVQAFNRDHDLTFLRAWFGSTGGEAYSAQVRWRNGQWTLDIWRIDASGEYPHWLTQPVRANE